MFLTPNSSVWCAQMPHALGRWRHEGIIGLLVRTIEKYAGARDPCGLGERVNGCTSVVGLNPFCPTRLQLNTTTNYHHFVVIVSIRVITPKTVPTLISDCSGNP
jgi:hypothetical protein